MEMPLIKRIVITEIAGSILLLLVSAILAHVKHLPSVITLAQLLCLELLVIILPVRSLLNTKLKLSKRPASLAHLYFEIGLFSVLSVVITVVSYLSFYARHNVAPAYMDSANSLHLQAMSLACLTFFLCQTLNMVFFMQDDHPRMSLTHLLSDQKLIKKWFRAGIGLLAILYFPLTHGFFHTRPLSLVDWSTAIFFAGLYFGMRVVQRHTRMHTRHAVLHLQQQLNEN